MNQPIHPFPARMAPELALGVLRSSDRTIRVLDPMSGSGTALRHASTLGYEAHGCDLDPLAVLMSRVWTTPINTQVLKDACTLTINVALELNSDEVQLPWIDDDLETKDFIAFWFGPKQISQLRRIACVLMNPQKYLTADVNFRVLNALRISLSRIIITKEQKASLARDTSHSRPHRVVKKSDYDVFQGFKLSVQQVAKRLSTSNLDGSAHIKIGDARDLDYNDERFDMILTSPPYLNAIDYMRGHKFSLVWLGYRLDELRNIRSTSIGAEKAPNGGESGLDKVMSAFGDVSKLPARHTRMIERYAVDLTKVMCEAARVLKPLGKATYVVGNSCLQGTYISNSGAVIAAGSIAGLRLVKQDERGLPQNRRYLPVNTNSQLRKRMRTETILSFEKS